MGVTLAFLIAPGTELTKLFKKTEFLVRHTRVERALAVDVDDYAKVTPSW